METTIVTLMAAIKSEQVKAYVSMFVTPMLGMALVSILGFLGSAIRNDLKEINVRLQQNTIQSSQLTIEMNHMKEDILELKQEIKEIKEIRSGNE